MYWAGLGLVPTGRGGGCVVAVSSRIASLTPLFIVGDPDCRMDAGTLIPVVSGLEGCEPLCDKPGLRANDIASGCSLVAGAEVAGIGAPTLNPFTALRPGLLTIGVGVGCFACLLSVIEILAFCESGGPV